MEGDGGCRDAEGGRNGRRFVSTGEKQRNPGLGRGQALTSGKRLGARRRRLLAVAEQDRDPGRVSIRLKRYYEQRVAPCTVRPGQAERAGADGGLGESGGLADVAGSFAWGCLGLEGPVGYVHLDRLEPAG